MTCDPLLAWAQERQGAIQEARAAAHKRDLMASAAPIEGHPFKNLKQPVQACCLPMSAALGSELAYNALYAACIEGFWRAHGLGFPFFPPALVLGHMALRRLTPDVRRLVDAVVEAGLEHEGEEWLCWVHSKWTKPEQEEINAYMHEGGKASFAQAARDTQIFTDRYMVEWIVQNTLCPLWVAICQRNGWVPEVVASGALEEMERRREVWREARAAGEVPLEHVIDLGPHAALWGRYVTRPIPESLRGAVPLADIDPVTQANAPASLDALRVMELAVGTGAFVIGYLDHLLPFMEEEDRHRGRVRTKVERAAAAAQTLSAMDIDLRCINVCKAITYTRLARYAGETVRVKLNIASSPPLQLQGATKQQVSDLAAVLVESVETLPYALHQGALWKPGAVLEPPDGPSRYEAVARLLEVPALVEGMPLADAARRLALTLGEGAEDPEREGWKVLVGMCIDRFTSPWFHLGLGGGVTGNLVREATP